MLCSVLLPSRARPGGLLRAVKSIIDHAEGQINKDYEILIRIDYDDAASCSIVHQLYELGARVICGDRGKGMEMLGRVYYTGLCALSEATWVWIFNDDAIVEEGVWDRELRKAPVPGWMAHPEVSKLGGSTYWHAAWQAFPWYVRDCWKAYGFPEGIPEASDVAIYSALRDHGWQNYFLSGVILWHRP